MISHKKSWLILGFTSLYSLVPAISTMAITTNLPSYSQQLPDNSIAQVSNCREVNVNTALNIRREPWGQVVGVLEDGDTVTIVGEPENDWVRINAPMEGYVATSFLTYCPGANVPTTDVSATVDDDDGAAVPGSNCREVNRTTPVRSSPDGDIILRLRENQAVIIANEGSNGWVPIEEPVSGFVSAQYLRTCSEDTAAIVDEDDVSTVTGSNCRRIVAADAPVRSEPRGDIIGTLDLNQTVTIANEGNSGWVPIEEPVSGYVSGSNLGYCSD